MVVVAGGDVAVAGTEVNVAVAGVGVGVTDGIGVFVGTGVSVGAEALSAGTLVAVAVSVGAVVLVGDAVGGLVKVGEAESVLVAVRVAVVVGDGVLVALLVGVLVAVLVGVSEGVPKTWAPTMRVLAAITWSSPISRGTTRTRSAHTARAVRRWPCAGALVGWRIPSPSIACGPGGLAERSGDRQLDQPALRHRQDGRVCHWHAEIASRFLCCAGFPLVGSHTMPRRRAGVYPLPDDRPAPDQPAPYAATPVGTG
jgi:pyruvate/2-oxoglutarate dehydrogenase complex dihydrolipoamide acyltransferase (E2) component